jgi:hypothetical protein
VGWKSDRPIAGGRVAECRRERLDVSTERGEIDSERLRQVREKLRVAIGEERERTAEIGGLVVMETDGHLDQALKDLALIALRFPPRRLEKLVHLEEETMLEENRRGGDRVRPRLARELRRTDRAKRGVEPLGTRTERGQLAREIGPEDRAVDAFGEKAALSKQAPRFFVEGRAPRGVGAARELEERVHVFRCVVGIDCLEQPFRDRVSERELHRESAVAAVARRW